MPWLHRANLLHLVVIDSFLVFVVVFYIAGCLIFVEEEEEEVTSFLVACRLVLCFDELAAPFSALRDKEMLCVSSWSERKLLLCQVRCLI
jgi:hypothetical protein